MVTNIQKKYEMSPYRMLNLFKLIRVQPEECGKQMHVENSKEITLLQCVFFHFFRYW